MGTTKYKFSVSSDAVPGVYKDRYSPEAYKRIQEKNRIRAKSEASRLRKNERSRQRSKTLPVRHSRYIEAAKKRNIPWDVDPLLFEDLATSPCFYCGALPNPLNGLDRVHNDKGYFFGNVVSCCCDCNRAKNAMPVAKFVSWLSRLTSRLEGTKEALCG